MNATQRITTALLAVLMVGTILTLPPAFPGKPAAPRHAGTVMAAQPAAEMPGDRRSH